MTTHDKYDPLLASIIKSEYDSGYNENENPSPKKRMLKKKAPVVESSPGQEPDSGLGNMDPKLKGSLMIALAGLAGGHMGSTMFGSMKGSGVAGKALLEEDRRGYELNSALLKRKISSEKKDKIGKLHRIFNRATGRHTYETAEDSVGKDVSFAPSVLKDDFGVQHLVQRSAPKTQEQVFDTEKYKGYDIPPEWRKAAPKVITNFIQLNKKEIQSYKDMKKGFNLLKARGELPQKVALNMAVKITEQRATDEDRDFVLGRISYFERTLELIAKEKDPIEKQRMTMEARELFENLGDTLDTMVSNSINRIAAGESEGHKGKQIFLKDKLSGYYGVRPRGMVSLGKTEIVPDKENKLPPVGTIGVRDGKRYEHIGNNGWKYIGDVK